MVFEFTNKPPTTPDTGTAFSAFKPLPTLPSTSLSARSLVGPVVTTSKATPSTPRTPVVFAARTSNVESDSKGDSDALSLFTKSNPRSRPQLWDRQEKPEHREAGKRFACACPKHSTTSRPYQPSTAAHTVPHSALPTILDDSAPTVQPFRFMDLPGEMRNRVYLAALSPGYISFRSCADHHMPIGVKPAVTTSLYTVSKQLAHETKDLIFENTFIINLALHSGIMPVIHHEQLPPHILNKVQHAVFVVDFTRACSDAPFRIDWRPVQKMTSLKTLRLCGIQMWPLATGSNPGDSLNRHHKVVIKTILECVPADCVVEFGWGSEFEEEHVRDMHHRITKLVGTSRQYFKTAEISTPEELSAVAQEVKEDIEKGSKSGSDKDYRYHREKHLEDL